LQSLLKRMKFCYNIVMEEPFFKFSGLGKFPEIIHGISFRSYGDMRFGSLPDKEVVKNRQQFFLTLGINSDDVVCCDQIHGNNILVVGEGEKGKGVLDKDTSISETDGLITENKDIFLMIKTADCLPIMLYDPIKQVTAILHVGWRGLLGQIILRAIDKLINIGCNPENITAGIGPGICQKHFIVRNNVLKEFLASFPSATMVRNKDGYVDLKKAASIDLKKGEIPESNIEVAKYCTVCDNGLFASFRKEGSGAPEIASVIGIKK
jgi:polyphenol oxidase